MIYRFKGNRLPRFTLGNVEVTWVNCNIVRFCTLLDKIVNNREKKLDLCHLSALWQFCLSTPIFTTLFIMACLMQYDFVGFSLIFYRLQQAEFIQYVSFHHVRS